MPEKSVSARAKDAFGWDVSPIEDGYSVNTNDERGTIQLGTLELEHWVDDHDEAKRQAERPWWRFW